MKDINFTNKETKFKDLEENKIYYFTQDEGYSDGILITITGSKVLIGHFYGANEDEFKYDSESSGLNMFFLLDLRVIDILKSGKYVLEYLDINIFGEIAELDIWDIYNDIYLNIYSYIWGSGNLEKEDEKYFEVINTYKDYKELDLKNSNWL